MIEHKDRRPHSAWIVLALYATGGFSISLLVPVLKAFGASYLGRDGYGVAIVVNIVLPVFYIVAATWYPTWSVALPGTLVAILTFMFATGMLAVPFSGNWIESLRRMEPVFVVACVAYHVISFVTVPVVRSMRRVGFPSGV